MEPINDAEVEEQIREKVVEQVTPVPPPTEVREVGWSRSPEREAAAERAREEYLGTPPLPPPANRYRQVTLNLPQNLIDHIDSRRGTGPKAPPLSDVLANLIILGVRTAEAASAQGVTSKTPQPEGATARPTAPVSQAIRAKLQALRAPADG